MVPLDFAAGWTAESRAGRAPCHPGVALLVLQCLCRGFGRGEPQLALAACAAVLG